MARGLIKFVPLIILVWEILNFFATNNDGQAKMCNIYDVEMKVIAGV